MKILWHSNAPFAATGYGNQTALFAPRLQKLGHDVAISAFYGLQGSILEWNGIRVYPGGSDGYGNDVMSEHAEHWFDGEPGIIITLVDAWVMDAAKLSRLPVACWAPVDHSPVPPRVRDFFLSSNARPIAMSSFGHEEFKTAGLNPLLVPHGVDPRQFYEDDQAECRERVGLPADAFVIGVVAANKGWPARKGWPQLLQAFANHLAEFPESVMYVHTEAGNRYGGMDLAHHALELKIPGDNLLFCDQYKNVAGIFGHDYMRDVYNGIDVLLNPSTGEGFGIPIIEAQACGTPVIATDSTSMTELVGPGWLVHGERWWTEQGAWQVMPSVSEIERRLKNAQMLRTDGDRGFWEAMSEACIDNAMQYDADLVLERDWAPTLEALEADLLEPKIDPAEAFKCLS